MDEIEGAGGASVLGGIPSDALTLGLSRSTIKMRHTASWRVEKSNDVHDLVVCLTGSARYELDGVSLVLEPGDAMLIPAGSRFVGWLNDGALYTGLAQHFTLTLFGNADLIGQMQLRPKARFARWDLVEPMVRHYLAIAPASSTTLVQYPIFMFILLDYLEAAFVSWREQALAGSASPDALSLHIMLVAARIAGDPLREGVLEECLASLPYNLDYFRRAFRQRIGYTPAKFVEFKRLERAMNWLAAGHSVKQAAARTGFSDVYYFSRQFKRYFGTSPSSYRLLVKSREGRHFVEESGVVMGLPSAFDPEKALGP
ncbi:AraC-type DNA-binding protein [Devosia enhydra]|uniref:AraC-type DNA-binding protein n=1 Tax=Devosia enhydra TaxID=665118 RepID=A0A1K2I3M1_9HYPH|nr:AraC family transcriptional regulator [Devosia enhydra]SFZ86819.1 AraC-type DNA-binding protein [Devosia enhydra]